MKPLLVDTLTTTSSSKTLLQTMVMVVVEVFDP
jgi:hypothetical protein